MVAVVALHSFVWRRASVPRKELYRRLPEKPAIRTVSILAPGAERVQQISVSIWTEIYFRIVWSVGTLLKNLRKRNANELPDLRFRCMQKRTEKQLSVQPAAVHDEPVVPSVECLGRMERLQRQLRRGTKRTKADVLDWQAGLRRLPGSRLSTRSV